MAALLVSKTLVYGPQGVIALHLSRGSPGLGVYMGAEVFSAGLDYPAICPNIPALESAHAVAECIKLAPKMTASDIVVVNISGRGDKDIGIFGENLAL